MKHVNKGHEFDAIAKKIQDRISGLNRYLYVYGTGLIYKNIEKTLNFFDCVAGYIDSNQTKQGQTINNLTVLSLEDYLANKTGEIILVAVSSKYQEEIEIVLKANGLVHKEDYYFYEEFLDYYLPIIAAYVHNKAYVEFAQMTLTNRCTLKCKDCAHGCNGIVEDKNEMNIEFAKYTVDSFFEKVDFASKFALIGGEPLLFNETETIAEYIKKNYSQKVEKIIVITNGTLLPSKKSLSIFCENEIEFNISNYTKNIPSLINKQKQLIQLLEDNKIKYIISSPDMKWVDFNFKQPPRKEPVETTANRYLLCNPSCRKIHGSKFYLCYPAADTAINKNYEDCQDDYLDLKMINESNKKAILEYHLGYSDKGYLEMCRRCDGYIAINNNFVDVAIQMD